MEIASNIVVLVFFISSVSAKLEEVYKWNHLKWKWPSDEAKNNAIKLGEYVPGNSMPNGILPWKNKLFVTVPRWKRGVPSTLNYIPLNSTDPSPALIPYPNWESNYLTNDNEKLGSVIVSIFRIDVDPCDRLWVLDTGLVDLMGKKKVIRPPTLIIFDLKNDTEIRKFEMKPGREGTYYQGSMFAHIIVDVTDDKCDQAFAYIPDISFNSLVVYSFADNTAWRVKHNYFYSEPLKGELTYAELKWTWSDGIFSLALGPADKNGDRTAYFHALIGTHEFSVNTSVLKNKTLATNKRENFHLFKILGKKGENAYSSSSTFDAKNGILFMAQMLDDGVGCWNTNRNFSANNFGLVAQDHDKNVFPNDIKIDENGNLWILSDKMPMFMFNRLEPTKVNYRILKIPIEEAINGTVCEL